MTSGNEVEYDPIQSSITIVQSYMYMCILENIMSLLPSVFLRVHSMSNNANSNKTSDIFSSIALYYGDNDFIIRTFNFNARSDT